MKKSTKIIIGITVAILVVLAGFLLLGKPSGTERSIFETANPSQNASGLEHIIRPIMHGGFPGDGGGG